jgi:hypothetical protein
MFVDFVLSGLAEAENLPIGIGGGEKSDRWGGEIGVIREIDCVRVVCGCVNGESLRGDDADMLCWSNEAWCDRGEGRMEGACGARKAGGGLKAVVRCVMGVVKYGSPVDSKVSCGVVPRDNGISEAVDE